MHASGARQWTFFVQRDELTEHLLAVAATQSQGQPLYELFARHKVACEAVFGWAAYATALTMLKRRAAGGGRGPASADPRIAAVAGRELAGIEPAMSQDFWTLYESAAALLAGGAVDDQGAVHLRAFLRYGMIGQAGWLLEPEAARRILADCAEAKRALDPACQATHVLYADEYIDLAARGAITPSIDEDLELNRRGSPAWRRDKVWRRTISSAVRLASLNQTTQELWARIKQLEDASEQQTRQLAQTPRSRRGSTRSSAGAAWRPSRKTRWPSPG